MRARVLIALLTNRMRHYLAEISNPRVGTYDRYHRKIVQHTNEPIPKPSVKHELCSQYKNSPKYFQGGTACQQSNLFAVSK